MLIYNSQSSRRRAILAALLFLFSVPGFASNCVPDTESADAPLRVITQTPSITGNIVADQRIRLLARSRGYLLQAAMADTNRLVFPYSIHQCVLPDWRALQQAAMEQGFKLSIVSGYRSVAKQRQIFLSKLATLKTEPESIAAGVADDAVQSILEFSSIPGFSRHHSGFAIDIQENWGGLTAFGQSKAYTWISENNFQVARKFGFVPSYPPGLHNQGPVPEAWEFLWIGEAAKSPSHKEPGVDQNPLNAGLRILAALNTEKHLPDDIATTTRPDTRSTTVEQTLPGG